MKNTILLIVLLYSFVNLFSQEKNKIFVYKEISNELITTNKLYIDSGYSLWFQSDDAKLIESKKEEFLNYRLSKNKKNIILFKNLKENKIYQNYNLFGKVFYVRDSLSTMKWNLIDSTQIILGFKCQMAKTKFRGRNYFAFFTPKINIPNGPWKFHGLPGMILKIESNDHYEHYEMECVEINNHNENIEKKYQEFVNKNEFITWQELEEEFVKFMDNTFKRLLSSDKTTQSGGTITLEVRNKKEIISEAYQLNGVEKNAN